MHSRSLKKSQNLIKKTINFIVMIQILALRLCFNKYSAQRAISKWFLEVHVIRNRRERTKSAY